MQRRGFLKGLTALGLCPLCAPIGFAAEEAHWSYSGETGPDHWGALSKANAACSIGSRQSPIDIDSAVDALHPGPLIEWRRSMSTIVNNGHTIQVNPGTGGRLVSGGRTFELLQFHFHAPSEHTVDGRSFPMEAHFVHGDGAGGLGVLGVFMVPGAANRTFAALAAAFPQVSGGKAGIELDPRGLLPGNRDDWTYQGSLTTPPCSEIVDWMVVKEPLEVAEADIAAFTALYPNNARPTFVTSRR